MLSRLVDPSKMVAREPGAAPPNSAKPAALLLQLGPTSLRRVDQSSSPSPDFGAQLARLETGLKRLQKAVDALSKLCEPFGAYLGDDIVLTQTVTGLRFMVPASDAVMAPKMIGSRVWEPRITRRLGDLVRPDRHFIDVGANIGYFAVSVAALLGNHGGKVYAFEPNPRIFNLLKRNDQINWSIAPMQLRQVALGAAQGTLTLSLPNKQASNGSVLERPMEGAEVERYQVEVVRFDDLSDVEFARIGLMKVDVEGAEAMVFRGAEKIFSSNPDIDIIIEWDTSAQKHDVGATAWLIEFFERHGYSAYSFEESLKQVSIRGLGRISYCNLFMTKRPPWWS
jgi:FkbM family methyltransferase